MPGVWKSRHSSEPPQVSGDLQGDVEDAGGVAARPVVLGGDGRVLKRREVLVPSLCLGTHAPATNHCEDFTW